jgi:hypothetical protein
MQSGRERVLSARCYDTKNAVECQNTAAKTCKALYSSPFDNIQLAKFFVVG